MFSWPNKGERRKEDCFGKMGNSSRKARHGPKKSEPDGAHTNLEAGTGAIEDTKAAPEKADSWLKDLVVYQASFPDLYSFMPTMYAVVVESSAITREPGIVSLNDFEVKVEKVCSTVPEDAESPKESCWIVIISYPGLDSLGKKEYPDISGIKNFFKNCRRLKEEQVQLFIISGDNFKTMRRIRDNIEHELQLAGFDMTDFESITFISESSSNTIGRKLAVVGTKSSPEDPSFYHPSCHIFTPDKELVHRVIIQDPDQMSNTSFNNCFVFPFTQHVVDSIFQTIDEIRPHYEFTLFLKENVYKKETKKPDVTVGSLVYAAKKIAKK